MHDVESVLRWWRICPQRHGAQLQAIARLRAELRPVVAEVRRRARLELAQARGGRG